MITLISKNKFWLKWVCAAFLLFSLFLARIDKSACLVCAAIFWSIASLLLVDKIKKEKFVLKFLAVVLLLIFAFPLVLNYVYALSDATINTFTSNVADNSAYTFQRNCGELIKLKTCVSNMFETGNVKQMNKTFVWHLFIPGLVVCLCFVIRFGWDMPRAVWKRFRAKGM